MGVGACYMTNLVGQAARVRLRQHFGRLDCLKAKQVLALGHKSRAHFARLHDASAKKQHVKVGLPFD